jgi:DNA replication protein DnaC
MATPKKPDPNAVINAQLDYLKLSFIQEHYLEFARQAGEEHQDHITFLARLLEGETLRRQARSVERRIRLARFPVRKTLEQFNWSWPREVNRLQVQNLFRLRFIDEHANVIFIGGVGLGKTHLATALGLAACEQGHSVLFASAVDVVNTLAAAQAIGQLKTELRKYLRPHVLVLDELGYLPIDKTGADLLFQIISHRYECGSTVITTNRTFKNWAKIFNHDATLTSAVLDRLLHHAETVKIEGKSYRMKDRINEPSDTPLANPANNDTTTKIPD